MHGRLVRRLRKSVTFWIIIIEAAIVIALYLFGFRITYGSNLETSWDAVSAIGQWASIIVGILIPISVVYLQQELEKNRQDIGEANLELYNEFKEFKQEYLEKLKVLSEMVDDNGNIVIDGGDFTNNSKDDLKEKALKLINISMFAKTQNVAEHLNINKEEAFNLLVEMLRHDESISCGGQVIKENMDNIIWTKKNKR